MELNSILVVGCGNMAGAMLEGWIASGVPAQNFLVYNRSPRDLPEGVVRLETLPDTGAFDAVLLGVKPQQLDDVAAKIEPLCGPQTVLLSILAGIRVDTLARRFPRARGQVRVMPNLAAALGKSPIALAAGELDDEGREAVSAFCDRLGHAEWVPEDEYDAVTALAGSGPAFVYRFIDALARGAQELGLDEDQARRLAVTMVDGAAALAAASPHSPGELARRVASPGGVTQAGLDRLDRDGEFDRLVAETLRDARARSAQMAEIAEEEG